jgi:hypothetical protein
MNGWERTVKEELQKKQALRIFGKARQRLMQIRYAK